MKPNFEATSSPFSLPMRGLGSRFDVEKASISSDSLSLLTLCISAKLLLSLLSRRFSSGVGAFFKGGAGESLSPLLSFLSKRALLDFGLSTEFFLVVQLGLDGALTGCSFVLDSECLEEREKRREERLIGGVLDVGA